MSFMFGLLILVWPCLMIIWSCSTEEEDASSADHGCALIGSWACQSALLHRSWYRSVPARSWQPRLLISLDSKCQGALPKPHGLFLLPHPLASRFGGQPVTPMWRAISKLVALTSKMGSHTSSVLMHTFSPHISTSHIGIWAPINDGKIITSSGFLGNI